MDLPKAITPLLDRLRERLRSPITRLVLAGALSWLVIFNTLLVSVHNLGARKDIGYINGGKVFRLSGTMWYHLPGLQEIGLAPQNIGGQINLRNNEFALLDRPFREIRRVEVDFALAPDALLMIILDRHREGTFTAVRLTAFEAEDTPFVAALVRFEKGEVAQRIPLDQLPARLTPGEHTAVVELDRGRLTVTVDGDTSQTLPFATEAIRPRPALGCGERNTTITRWRVAGTGEDGQAQEWEESFTLSGTIERSLTPVALLTTLVWLLLLVGPLTKVGFETRTAPTVLAPRALLFPTPRWIFGLFCLVPWMPMVLQWSLGGLYVVYAWITLWEAILAGHETWRVRPHDESPVDDVSRGRRSGSVWWWGAAGLALLCCAGALYAASAAVRNLPIDQEIGAGSGKRPVLERGAMTPLLLGQRIELDVQTRKLEEGRVTFDVLLGPGQIIRADLIEAMPPIKDVYQVDRSQDRPESAKGDDGQPEEQEDEGPSDYELSGVSLFVSTDPQMPCQLRRLHSDKVELSPHVGWAVEPGRHTIVLSAAGRYAVAAIDGKVVDFRADLNPAFEIGAIQLLSHSDKVDKVGNITVGDAADESVSQVESSVFWANTLAVPALILLICGLFLLVFGAATRLAFSRRTALVALVRMARGHLLLALWLVWWLAEEMGTVDWAGERFQIVVAVIAIGFAAFNVTQIVRQTARDRRWWERAASWALVGVLAIGSFEGVCRLFPERRFNWTHYWNHELGPRHLWVHDPMIRRLNPWFIDHRFKRRERVAAHPKKTRIVVFGGSQTYGWGIPSRDRETFSDQLEVALHARRHTEVEVINAAFPGVKTATGLRWFTGNLLRYEPDIVVINFVVNEFMNVDQYHVWAGEHPGGGTLSPLVSLALLERWRGDFMGSHLSQIIVADVYEVYAMEQYLRWWVDIARKRGVKVVFSIEPTNLYVESGGRVIMRSETSMGSAQGVYRALAKELEIPLFDVLPHFVAAQENIWFYDTMHMSRLGHRVFAKNLAKLIDDKLLPEPVTAGTE